MIIKELIEDLKKYPEDATVCLSKLLVVKEEEEGDVYELILDQPVHGIAFNQDDNELRLVLVDEKGSLSPSLGEVKKLPLEHEKNS